MLTPNNIGCDWRRVTAVDPCWSADIDSGANGPHISNQDWSIGLTWLAIDHVTQLHLTPASVTCLASDLLTIVTLEHLIYHYNIYLTFNILKYLVSSFFIWTVETEL